MAWRPQVVRTDATNVSPLTDEVEFLASEHFTAKRVGITIDASLVGADVNGDKILKKGTVMARVTSTGRYAPYVSGGSGGREVAKGFLMESVNLKWGNVVTGLIIGGSVIAQRCSGLTSGAESDLVGTFTFQ